MTFKNFNICHRTAPLRKLCSMTLTNIFKVKIANSCCCRFVRHRRRVDLVNKCDRHSHLIKYKNKSFSFIAQMCRFVFLSHSQSSLAFKHATDITRVSPLTITPGTQTRHRHNKGPPFTTTLGTQICHRYI